VEGYWGVRGVEISLICRHALIIVVACKTTLNTCSEPHQLKCLRGSMVAYAGDGGLNLAARTVLVAFFVFFFFRLFYC